MMPAALPAALGCSSCTSIESIMCPSSVNILQSLLTSKASLLAPSHVPVLFNTSPALLHPISEQSSHSLPSAVLKLDSALFKISADGAGSPTTH